jgi:hypothetical protein
MILSTPNGYAYFLRLVDILSVDFFYLNEYTADASGNKNLAVRTGG